MTIPPEVLCGRCGLPGGLDLDTGGTYHPALMECVVLLKAALEASEQKLASMTLTEIQSGVDCTGKDAWDWLLAAYLEADPRGPPEWVIREIEHHFYPYEAERLKEIWDAIETWGEARAREAEKGWGVLNGYRLAAEVIEGLSDEEMKPLHRARLVAILREKGNA